MLTWLSQISFTDISIDAFISTHKVILAAIPIALWRILKAWAILKPSVTTNTVTELFTELMYGRPPASPESKT